MKVMDWESVEESAPFGRPPAGGYVVRIVAVENCAPKEYLTVVYDIAEGPLAGFYSDEFGAKNAWAHRFVRSYKESAKGMFKAFLKRLEESNPGFSVARWQARSNELELVGLLLGVVLQVELYTNDQGEDRERLQVAGVYAAQAIRAGEFRVPGPKDCRKAVPAAAAEPAGLPAAPPPSALPVWAQGETVPLSAYGDLPY